MGGNRASILKPVVRSGSISRYSATSTALVLFPYEVSSPSARLLNQEEMNSLYPLSWAYLSQNRKQLEGREKGKFRDVCGTDLDGHRTWACGNRPKS